MARWQPLHFPIFSLRRRRNLTREEPLVATAIVFWETDFPQIDGCLITREILDEALTGFDVSYVSEQQLIETTAGR